MSTQTRGGGVRTRILPLQALTALEIYAVARLRQEVFVVEQECAYLDLDGRDLEPTTRHVLLEDEDATLVGYARVLREGDEDRGEHLRIGRVVLASHARGRGWGDLVLEAALSVCVDRTVVLDAQSPLATWYAGHGFTVVGPEFVEDGIPHMPMKRAEATEA